MHRRRRAAARLAAAMTGVVLIGSAVPALLPAATATDAGGRQAAVDKATGLANEVVTVSWSGFRPTTNAGDFAVVVYQCRANPTSTADCFTGEPFPALAEGNRQIGRTGQNGTGSVPFEVRPAANLPQLGCSATNPCSIVVFENDGVPPPPDGLPATAVVVPIAFAPSQADCPPITRFDLRTDGASSSAGALYAWSAALCRDASPFVLDYTETSSTAGRENFLEGLVDLGITSMSADEEELEAHPGHREFAYAPIDLTAVVVVVNMRDPFTGNQISDLVLSPRLVARLVTDSNVASFLADPELRELNPRTRFPSVGLSHPLLRAERNAATYLLTRWMTSSPGAQQFLAGADAYGVSRNSSYAGIPYPRHLFENIAQSSEFLPRTGQRNVALRVFYGVRPTGASRESSEQTGFIGVVDLPTARRFGLPTARILNAAGVAVAPTQESILAGYQAMRADEHGVLVADVTALDPAAYPLVKVDYAMVPIAPASPVLVANLKRVLQYATGDGQANLPAGYVPLPSALRQRTQQVANQIAVRSSTTTTTTTVPPTTVPPTTVPPTTVPPTTVLPTTVPPETTEPPVTPTTVPSVTSPPFDPNLIVGGGSGGDDGGGSSGTGSFDELESEADEELPLDEPPAGDGIEGETGEHPVEAADQSAPAAPVPTSEPPPPPSLRPLPSSQAPMLLPLLQLLAGLALIGWAGMHTPVAWRWIRERAGSIKRRLRPARTAEAGA